jgi:hypothetical protein
MLRLPDASITGASGKLYVNASINTNWHINNPVWYTSDHFLVYANDKNDTDAYQTAIQLQGGDLIIGNANEAHGAFFGNGTAFSKENYDYVFATSGIMITCLQQVGTQVRLKEMV